MKMKFLICKHCGNILAMIRDRGVPVYCCSEKMQELIPGATEASGEKHIPVYEVTGNTVHVTVGSVEHPMTAEHYIEWVCLETEHGIQYAHLNPDDKPKAKFALCGIFLLEGAAKRNICVKLLWNWALLRKILFWRIVHRIPLRISYLRWKNYSEASA